MVNPECARYALSVSDVFNTPASSGISRLLNLIQKLDKKCLIVKSDYLNEYVKV